ncbi:MAG: hypothetical protein J6U23_09045 [Clostridiales bacterium]|nr:hypothetical protein [Clostridiales bacterium]
MKSLKVCAVILASLFLLTACPLKEGDVPLPRNKVAVFFPGMGYTHERPLLSDSRKIFEDNGYEIKLIEWTDLPRNRSVEPACDQAAEQLDTMNLDRYEEVVFVSKSIGTVASSTYVANHDLEVKQIWYTPLIKSFEACNDNVEEGSIIAFIGTDDENANIAEVKSKAEILNIELHVYDDCDHSLETGDVSKDKEVLDDVMAVTSDYIKKKE